MLKEHNTVTPVRLEPAAFQFPMLQVFNIFKDLFCVFLSIYYCVVFWLMMLLLLLLFFCINLFEII